MRKARFGHAQIGDGGADRGVGDGDPDHQAEREQGIHDRLAPFGLGLAEMAIDVQRLGVQGHVGEQHVIHFGDRPAQLVLEDMTFVKLLEIKAWHRILLPDSASA